MTRDELISKLKGCYDAGICDYCTYKSSCKGYDNVLLDTLEYFNSEMAAEEGTKKRIERIKNKVGKGE